MVDHLTSKIRYLERLIPLTTGDVVLDIGSNDCTTLKAYERNDIKRIGIDPTGKKFAEYYPVDVALVPEFFSAAAYKSVSSKPAKIITSIAMFYDLDDPIAFAKQIEQCLDDDGVRSEEHTSELQSLMRTSYAVFCLKKKKYITILRTK